MSYIELEQLISFSAHDFFEDVWMDVSGNGKVLFQGLVQLSVGCYTKHDLVF